MKRSPRSLWSIAENAEPEWLMKVIPPAARLAGSWNPQARSRRSTLMNPMPFGPHSVMPASRAIDRSRSVRGGPAEGGSYALANTTADRAPAAALARSCSSSVAFDTPTTTTSTGSGTSAIDG